MPQPRRSPIGLPLARTAKDGGRAFDKALAEAGGSVPTWSILLALKTRPGRSQRELADAADIRGAILTHHLNALETEGVRLRTGLSSSEVAELEALLARLRDNAAEDGDQEPA